MKQQASRKIAFGVQRSSPPSRLGHPHEPSGGLTTTQQKVTTTPSSLLALPQSVTAGNGDGVTVTHV